MVEEHVVPVRFCLNLSKSWEKKKTARCVAALCLIKLLYPRFGFFRRFALYSKERKKNGQSCMDCGTWLLFSVADWDVCSVADWDVCILYILLLFIGFDSIRIARASRPSPKTSKIRLRKFISKNNQRTQHLLLLFFVWNWIARRNAAKLSDANSMHASV